MFSSSMASVSHSIWETLAHIITCGTQEFPDTHNLHFLLLLSIDSQILVLSCPFCTDFWHFQPWLITSLVGCPQNSWVPGQPRPAWLNPDNWCAKIWGPQNFYLA